MELTPMIPMKSFLGLYLLVIRTTVTAVVMANQLSRIIIIQVRLLLEKRNMKKNARGLKLMMM